MHQFTAENSSPPSASFPPVCVLKSLSVQMVGRNSVSFSFISEIKKINLSYILKYSNLQREQLGFRLRAKHRCGDSFLSLNNSVTLLVVDISLNLLTLTEEHSFTGLVISLCSTLHSGAKAGYMNLSSTKLKDMLSPERGE